MWDLFFAFLLIGMGVVLAIFELRQWILTKRYRHLVIVFVALASEVAINAGFLYALIFLVLAVVLRGLLFYPTANN